MSKRFFSMTARPRPRPSRLRSPSRRRRPARTRRKAPRLTLVEPIKDFGTVPKGREDRLGFEIKNTGTADLEILAAKPACGCTVADFDKVIKPGQTGKVTAHVDTTNFAGPIAKAVTLETNDPTTPNAQVTITADREAVRRGLSRPASSASTCSRATSRSRAVTHLLRGRRAVRDREGREPAGVDQGRRQEGRRRATSFRRSAATARTSTSSTSPSAAPTRASARWPRRSTSSRTPSTSRSTG